MAKTDPVRFDHGVSLYAPTAEAKRQQYRVCYRDRHDKRRTIWRNTYRDAREAALEVAHQLDQAASADPREANAVRPFDELAAAYLADSETTWSVSHAKNRESDYRRWVAPVVSGQPCNRVTTDDLSTVMRQVREAGRKPDGVYATLRAMVRYGLQRGYFDRDPLQGVVSKARGRQRHGQADVFIEHYLRPDTDSVERLAEAFAAVTGDWWRALEVRLAAYTGLRWGELHELRPGDIDLEEGTIAVDRQVCYPDGRRHLHLPKYGKVRTTFLPDFLSHATESRVKELEGTALPDGRTCSQRGCREVIPPGDGPLLFPSSTGNWPQPSRWRAWFRHACEHAGWPKDAEGDWRWDWHSLRHHFCTWALAVPPGGLGLEVADVSFFAGHSTAAFTWQAYVSTRQGAVARAREASRRV